MEGQDVSRRPPIAFLLAACMAIAGQCAYAGNAVTGRSTEFQSYNGVVEQCVRISPVPGGRYDDDDLDDEIDLCGIDFYSPNVGLCPKTWSTGPATMIYDISSGAMQGRRNEFQKEICAIGKPAKALTGGTLARFKVTVSQTGTSATNSTSSLLYYHLSRYFDLNVKVPVAVWRSMDKEIHMNEVALSGVVLTESACHGSLLFESWRALAAAEANPQSHKYRDDVFVPDRSKVFGALLNSPGSPYGPEMNGPGQALAESADFAAFQQTPAFRALKTDAPLDTAIDNALRAYWLTPFDRVRSGLEFSPQQIAFWMRDLSEILLMDFILNQQDRIGNISSKPYYYWMQYGDLRRKKAKNGRKPGDGDIPADAQLIHRTYLNDNDAGARVEYKNPSRDAGLLAGIRHFDPALYGRLIALNDDLQGGGPVRRWLDAAVGLEDAEVQLIVDNTELALELLRSNCRKGLLRFDLHPEEFFEKGAATTLPRAC